MSANFLQVDWSSEVADAARVLVQLAIIEDLAGQSDWTTKSLVLGDVQATARIVPRSAGVLAGGPIVPLVLEEMQADVKVTDLTDDGELIVPGTAVGVMKGNGADLLTCERIMLNFLGRLSGVASLTRQYVDAVAGTSVSIYDTRKTTPGWRLLEKYAVQCGGGCNHRLGLHAAVMIKDNHIALACDQGISLETALDQARAALDKQNAPVEVFEVEVDSLDQLQTILPARPDIVLLDNMSPATLRHAVDLRDRVAPDVVLEASGGVNLETVASIATSGVDRISVGALTHSAGVLDLGLDWGE
ncbi:MAG: carboxylating nicotinate-nucleotide diphosphorylase [Aeoliella sp.]